MFYRDFILRLSVREGDTYLAVVTQSPFGTGLGNFQIPPGLEGYRLPQTTGVRPVSRDLSPDFQFPNDGETTLLNPEDAGRALFDALFQGKIGELFLKSQEPMHCLRIKLILQEASDDPAALKLYGLPWELLYDHQFIAVNASFSLVRSLDGDISTSFEPRAQRSASTLKVLMVGSNPNDTNPLDTARELKLLEAMSSTDIHFEPLRDISRRGLHKKLEEGFHAVHFCGHGDHVAGEPVLFFLDEHGDADGVTGRALAEEIRALDKKHWPKLFVLNACHGGALALGPTGLTGIAAELHRAGLPVVVAMRQEVGDEAAIAFSQAFYQCLAKGKSVDEAMVKGRLSLKRETNYELDWATPCLFSHLEDGRFFSKTEPLKNEEITMGMSIVRAINRILKRFLFPGVMISFAVLVILFLVMRPRQGDVRLALAPFALKGGGTGGFFLERMDYMVAFSGIRGLTLVESGADYELSLNVSQEENILRSLLINSKNGKSLGFFKVNIPTANQDEAKADVVEQLVAKVVKALDLDPSADLAPHKNIPGSARLKNFQAMTFFAQGDLPRAEEKLMEAIEHFSDYAAAHANLAVILHGQARYEEALPHFNQAVELAPDFSLFHYHQGQCLISLQRKDEAEVAFGKAIELDPFAIESFHELAKIYLSKKDWNEAVRFLEVAISINPEAPVLHKTKGRVLVRRGWFKPAINPLTKALGFIEAGDFLQFGEINALLARAHFELNQFEEAGKAVKSFLSLPGAKLLPDYESVEKIRIALNLEELSTKVKNDLWVPPPKNAPHAFFTQLEGVFTIHDKLESIFTFYDEISRPASIYGGVQDGVSLHAHSGAKATLVCSGGASVVLTGPGWWQVDDSLCDGTSSEYNALLYQQLLAKTSRESSSMGTLLKMATRSAGNEEFVILSPLGRTILEEPQILWTHVPGAIGYKVVTDMGFGATTTEILTDESRPRQIAVGHETLTVMSIDWPDFPLSFGTHFTVRIFVNLVPEDSRTFDEIRLDADFVHEPVFSLLQTQLESLDKLNQDPALQKYLAAELLATQKVWGDAWQSQQKLLGMRDRPADKLQLARIWLDAGLDHFSKSILKSLGHAFLTREQNALVQQIYGLLALRAHAYGEARDYLGRARAIFQAVGNLRGVLEVDRALVSTEQGLKAQSHSDKEVSNL